MCLANGWHDGLLTLTTCEVRVRQDEEECDEGSCSGGGV
jgi:hypothetical protein